MARIVIPGGTGHLGRALSHRLVARGDDVAVLTRGPGGERDGVRLVSWDAATPGPWVQALDGADAIVHLCGRRVDVRAGRRTTDDLIASRVGPVTAVGAAVKKLAVPPPVWVQASSLAIYGDTGDTVVDESTTPSGIGPREMVTVCLAWENAAREAAAGLERLVVVRPGIGIGGRGDPATARLTQLTRLGLGGRVGSGRQWISWIALPDLIDVLLRAVDDPAMSGVYHAASPEPVTNAELMATFRRVLGRRIGLPTPAAVARVGAPLLGTNANLALTGRRCVPARLLAEGFRFRHPVLEPVIADAVANLSEDRGRS